MCRGVFCYYFLVIYLPKIAQHLFCGELLSQSFTVALTDAKGGHGPCSVILKPFVSTTWPFCLANLCPVLCFWFVLCLEMHIPWGLIWLGEYFSYLFYKMQKCTGICNNMHHLLALNMYCILALKTTNIFQLPPKPEFSAVFAVGPFPWLPTQVMKTFPVSWRINKPEHFCTSILGDKILLLLPKHIRKSKSADLNC